MKVQLELSLQAVRAAHCTTPPNIWHIGMGSSPLLNGIFWDLGQGNYFQHLQLETDPEKCENKLGWRQFGSHLQCSVTVFFTIGNELFSDLLIAWLCLHSLITLVGMGGIKKLYSINLDVTALVMAVGSSTSLPPHTISNA